MKAFDTSRSGCRFIDVIARTRLLRVLESCFYLTLVFGSAGSTMWSQQGLPPLPDGSSTGLDKTSSSDGSPVVPLLDRQGAGSIAPDALVLSSSQIFDVLSAHPDIIVELKQFL